MNKINFKKDHHLCSKVYLGSSDIATLIAVGCSQDGLKVMPISYGGDGDYSAYLCGKETEIPEYYTKVFQCDSWLKIYDDVRKTFDTDLTNQRYYKHFTIYRAGCFGTIILVDI